MERRQELWWDNGPSAFDGNGSGGEQILHHLGIGSSTYDSRMGIMMVVSTGNAGVKVDFWICRVCWGVVASLLDISVCRRSHSMVLRFVLLFFAWSNAFGKGSALRTNDMHLAIKPRRG